tara:strand:+ start:2639 stop:3586 length:948 start_codon:yes stop_codon:yes gene_type:complete
MAVFTKLKKTEIENFLDGYNIGKLDSYSEIVEGVENTNYKIICNKKPYILTIFEKRVKEEDLPFFMDLKLYLNNQNFSCPKPLRNKNENIINSIKNKKAVIITFIEGKKIDSPNHIECYEVGKMIGNLHNLTINFNQKRNNGLDITELKRILNKCDNNKNTDFIEICSELKNEINFLENSIPTNLPSGIVHADLFKDNIFFKEKKITGVIDFYFSCFHFLLYDISIVINDWCFEKNGNTFNNKFFNAIIEGYNLSRNLEKEELQSFNLILRIAAVRILITRIHDYIFHQNDSIVIKKDPREYFNILKWHQNNKVY